MARRSGAARFVVVVAVVVAVGVHSVQAGGAAKVPPGAAKPVAATGIGTKAALENPRCNTDDPRFGVYGRFDSTVRGGGPICVKPWKDGADNGGATAIGVTKDTVTVVAVVPNDEQMNGGSLAQGTVPSLRSDPATAAGTYVDAIHDYFLPLMRWYETWGRDFDVRIVTSSGSDEQAQRADAVAVKSVKPFAVMDMVTSGLDVLDAELAKSKILVYGDATTTAKATKQAPYRWGLSDAQAAAINSAEFIGKQLLGEKAEFAGSDDLQQQRRKFGVVYIPSLIDIDQFGRFFSKFGGKLASLNEYTSSGSTFGDDALAQEQAPIIVTRMKNAGVTTVIMLSDIAMNRAMMKVADTQEWFPEWFSTGALFQDLAIFTRSYSQTQAAHMFGLSNLPPYTQPDPTPPPPAKPLSVEIQPLEWYWGTGVGTQVPNVVPRGINWLLRGVHAAGPNLTPKTFQQGLFSIPATGGAASGYPTSFFVGFGRTPGLPYDEYMDLGLDFAPIWWDAETSGIGNATGTPGKGVIRYLDGAKRYISGTWPKKQFEFFDGEGTVIDFATRQTPTPEYVGDCTDCPAGGGPGAPGAPDSDHFVVKAYGVGQFQGS
jgi:hypothetical protein